MKPDTTTTSTTTVATSSTNIPNTQDVAVVPKKPRRGLIRRLSQRLVGSSRRKHNKHSKPSPWFLLSQDKTLSDTSEDDDVQTQASTPPTSPRSAVPKRIVQTTTTPDMQDFMKRLLLDEEQEEESFQSQDISVMTEDTTTTCEQHSALLLAGSMHDLGLLTREQDDSSEPGIFKDDDDSTNEPNLTKQVTRNETSTKEETVRLECVVAQEPRMYANHTTLQQEHQVTHKELNKATIARYAKSLHNNYPRHDTSPAFPAFRVKAPQKSSWPTDTCMAVTTFVMAIVLVLKLQADVGPFWSG